MQSFEVVYIFACGYGKAYIWKIFTHKSGLLIFRGKKSKISRDFQGQIRRKIGRFHGIFVGKQSKFAKQSADFTGEKSKFAEKSADFAGF